MKKIDKVILNVLEKVSRGIVEQEKNAHSACPVIFHQPRRPEKVKKQK